jgi:hypothetical protein
MTVSKTLLVVMLSVVIPNGIVMLNDVMLIVIILSVNAKFLTVANKSTGGQAVCHWAKTKCWHLHLFS